ncbi:MAG: hypothetical protein O8C59_03740 [Candidatus Methanoperedens sp.]|nr:hypothetical protein [Candidatus Methanoperedens sp.]
MSGFSVSPEIMLDTKLAAIINRRGMSIAPANINVHAIVKSVMPVIFSNHVMKGSQTSSMITVWLTTIPIKATARKDSSKRGFFMNQSSLVVACFHILRCCCAGRQCECS